LFECLLQIFPSFSPNCPDLQQIGFCDGARDVFLLFLESLTPSLSFFSFFFVARLVCFPQSVHKYSSALPKVISAMPGVSIILFSPLTIFFNRFLSTNVPPSMSSTGFIWVGIFLQWPFARSRRTRSPFFLLHFLCFFRERFLPISLLVPVLILVFVLNT